jgi:hypothetical protein
MCYFFTTKRNWLFLISKKNTTRSIWLNTSLKFAKIRPFFSDDSPCNPLHSSDVTFSSWWHIVQGDALVLYIPRINPNVNQVMMLCVSTSCDLLNQWQIPWTIEQSIKINHCSWFSYHFPMVFPRLRSGYSIITAWGSHPFRHRLAQRVPGWTGFCLGFSRSEHRKSNGVFGWFLIVDIPWYSIINPLYTEIYIYSWLNTIDLMTWNINKLMFFLKKNLGHVGKTMP